MTKKLVSILLTILMILSLGAATVSLAKTVLLGDVNGNGKIDGNDYMMIKRTVLKTYTLSEAGQAAADTNRNGRVDAGDYAMVKRTVLRTYDLKGATVEISEGGSTGDGELVVTVTKTDYRADHVHITGGYGELYTDFSWDEAPGHALIDRDGTMLFDWIHTLLSYTVSDGIVSLTGTSLYEVLYQDEPYGIDAPTFYKLDGTGAFDDSDIVIATPMINGRAIVFRGLPYESSTAPEIIDDKGRVLYTFPAEYGEGELDMSDPFSDKWFGSVQIGGISQGLVACGIPQDTGYVGYDAPCTSIYYLNESGEKVIELSGSESTFREVNPFFNGYARAGTGFINMNGEYVIPSEYDDAGQCYGDLFSVCKNDKWGYVNANNEVVIPLEYNWVCGASDGAAAVSKGGKCGIVDYENQVLVPFEYDSITGVENGVAYALKDGDVYIITISRK